MTAEKSIEKMSFETALSELETIVRNLEQGETPLDKSIKAYERGIALKRHCEAQLKDAKAKIDKITVGKDGSLSTQPLDSPSDS